MNGLESIETPIQSQGKKVDAASAYVALTHIYQAAERGVTRDLLAAYGRYLAACGREIDTEHPPRKMWNAAPLIPFRCIRSVETRLRMVHETIGEVSRWPAGAYGWQLCDATFKGWAYAEADLQQKCREQALNQAATHDDDGDENDAELCRKAADISGDEAAHYMALSLGEGWGQ